MPPGALGDVVEAIDGDGSALSYLSASLFAREVREFGAMWHGCDWNTDTILGANPLDVSPSSNATTDPRQWKWFESAPESWLPTVVTLHPAGVRFYSYTALHTERIVRHFDDYERGSCVFDAREDEIARGPGGFIF
jgi:hypothetical protein